MARGGRPLGAEDGSVGGRRVRRWGWGNGAPMAVTRRRMPHPPSAVLALLADGRRYADWVVGAKRIRAVDSTWPEVGSEFHHTVGVGPLSTSDTTEVLSFTRPDGPVVLKARAWPTGAARVTIACEPTPEGCEVVIDEVPLEGPMRSVQNPVLDGLIHLRNVESLRRMERALAAG